MTDNLSQADIQARAAQIRFYVSHHWGWFLTLGILLMIAGIAAIAFPFVSTLAAKFALGWVFLMTGIVTVIHAFGTSGWRAFALSLVVGLLYLAAGAYLAFFPLTGVITLTILLAALFIAEGWLEIMMAIRLQPDAGWVWVLLSGILAVGAGILIALQLPSSATWAIGLLAGINILASGISFVGLALAGRRHEERVAARTATA